MSMANHQHVPRRLRFNAFTTNSAQHIGWGAWRQADHDGNYLSMDKWVDLAKLLERGCFDALFFADLIGTYDVYGGGPASAMRNAVQFPLLDPAVALPTIARETEHLGLVFSQSVIQEPPFNFARRLTTLDHYTGGRIGWNVVTSFLQSAWNNLGAGQMASHADRYRRAEEYLQVQYKLLEGSWEPSAVVRDRAAGVYADPARIHAIDHEGPHYRVAGPHLSEPSPQRVPLLFQAGASEDGREFAARNAEAIFVAARSPHGATRIIDDITARAKKYGRSREDLMFFQAMTFVVGSSEEDARRKNAELDELTELEAVATMWSSTLGVDLSTIDLDTPVGELQTEAIQGSVRSLAEAAPDKEWTFGQAIRAMSYERVVGTPEQVAAELELWRDAGIDGVNMSHFTVPATFVDFIDGAVPVLQRRGLMQSEYRPGTLREKMYDGRIGPLVAPNHPAARFREDPRG